MQKVIRIIIPSLFILAISTVCSYFLLRKLTPLPTFSAQKVSQIGFLKITTEASEVFTFEKKEIAITEGLKLKAELPKFIKLEENKLILNPTKSDFGKHNILFVDTQNSFVSYEINIKRKPFDTKKLDSALKNLLGNNLTHYGIFLKDMQSGTSLKINESKTYPPASISKLPSVLLTLRDIDARKIKLESTFTILNRLKHTTFDSIGRLPQGTQVTFKTLIDAAVIESNNTAHYHLHEYLGGLSKVNPRTQKELGAKKFFVDPLESDANSVGAVMEGIYKQKFLSKKLNDYLLNILINNLPSLKTAIPGGVPAGLKVANKVGFLFGGQYGDTFADAAIVYGNKTDYVLVVLNDKALPFPSGSLIISEISKLVYNEIDK